jgi:hypothetical protein
MGPSMACIFEMRPFWSHFKIRDEECRHRIRCSGGLLEWHFRGTESPSNTQVALQDACQIAQPKFGPDDH